MKKLIMSLLVLWVLIPINVIQSQDEYMLQKIKEGLNKSDLNQIEKAEKYLSTANGEMKTANEIGDVGKNKNKALNKKISASSDYGKAHKIIYEVYLENVKRLSSNASNENSEKAKKNMEDASKLMKEAKKKRGSSLKVNVLEKAYELLAQAVENEKNAINGLAATYVLITDNGKKTSTEKIVKTEEGKIKDEPINDKVVVKNDEVNVNNNQKNENGNIKNNEVVDNDVVVDNNVTESKDKEIEGVYFKIQIAASKTTLTVDQLNAIYKTNEAFNVDKDGEWYKYYIGKKFKIYDEALAYKNNLKIKGIFVIAYKDGKRVTIEEALKQEDKKAVVDIKKDETIEDKAIQSSKIIYRLQIGISTRPLGQNEISEFKSAGQPVLSFDHGGWFSYNIGDFNNEKEAQNYKKTKGLIDAIVVKFIDGILVEE